MSSASRFLLFGSPLFLRTTNKAHTHKTLSPFLSFKPFLPLQFHLCSSSSSAATTDDYVITETFNSLQKQLKHPWSEWVNFVDKLKTRGYFMESYAREEDDNTTSDDVSTAGAYADMHQLKNGCLSFARDRYDVFKSLSMPDIQTVVESGCPNLLRKTVNSAKRLRAYLQLDEGDVCSACNLRDSCDRAYVILKGNEAEGRTIDIVRILMSYALDPLVISGGGEYPGRELFEAAARKLLSELIELTETPPDPALPNHTHKAAHKERDVDFMGGILYEHTEMKKGDWICPKCNFMNFSKNKRCRKCWEESSKKDGENKVEIKKGDWICSKCEFVNFSRNIKCLKCKAAGPERVDVEMKKGDWNCTKCGFMNFASRKTCLRCRDPRPERRTGEWNCPSCDFLNFGMNKVCLKCKTEHPERMNGEWHCPSCDFLNFSRNKICLKCDFKRPEEETNKYEEQIWKSLY